MDVLPRFLLVFCCENAEHCAKVRLQGPEGMAAGKKLLDDLAKLNAEMAAHPTGPGVNCLHRRPADRRGELLHGHAHGLSVRGVESRSGTWREAGLHQDWPGSA